jgi:succinoglycan biosynthesis protein ExoL
VKLAYFVHDLTDPAVTRRVRMLKAGGAQPVVVGFRRADVAPQSLEGCPTLDLGRTYDSRLGHRAKATLLAALRSGALRGALRGSAVVMARTLEMLAIAEAARWTCGLRAPLIYESLDIHRVLLGDTVKGYGLRSLERALMRRASLLVVSSPAFLDCYFRPIQGLGDDLHTPTMLVENKVLEPEGSGPSEQRLPPIPPGPPWRIGWLGAIRCARSLDILTSLAARRPDLLQVSIHGRPAYTEFADFDAQVAGAPNVRFGGAYTAADLPGLYGGVHFSWAMDFMEEGLNSAWLLPNRVYESGRYGAPPIALAGVETGRWLAERGFGVRLADPADLEGFLQALTPGRYAELRAELEAAPQSVFVAGEADCRRLVEGLKNPALAVGSHGQASQTAAATLAA